MSNESSGYLVARCENTVYVRAQGLANMKNAPTLDAFLRQESDEGMTTACIDLSECTGMDSTFMGTLVGFHHRLSAEGGRVLVVNPSVSNGKLLDMLGVSTVLPVLKDQTVPDLKFLQLQAGEVQSPLARATFMKQAHIQLVELSEQNSSKFAPFLAAIEADLSRLNGDSGSENGSETASEK